MSSVIYSGDRGERATATAYLERRIEINSAYSSADFDKWLFDRLAVKLGEHVLDVGCGSGKQTIPIARMVGPSGSVSSIDISPESIDLLKSRLSADLQVEAVAVDMADLARVIADVFAVKRYTLVHSSYALYYSPKRLDVLDVMRSALQPGGRCAVFTPDRPHGLVELAARFGHLPASVDESLRFGPEVLQPYFERNFRGVMVHRFHNVVTVPTADILVEFYRQTTYYDANVEPAIRTAADEEVRRKGNFEYEKNGYLIVGFVDD
jgi:ubiquinone/menaquinone biosynthesis C-methylase UbiE